MNRITEIDLIKQIEEFRPELQPVSLRDWNVLDDGEIQVCESRTAQNSSSGIAVLPQERVYRSKGSAVLLLNHRRIPGLSSELALATNKCPGVEKLIDHSSPAGMIKSDKGTGEEGVLGAASSV